MHIDLIQILILLGVFAIAWAVVRHLSLPPFVMTVLYVVGGIIAIIFLLNLAGTGPSISLR